MELGLCDSSLRLRLESSRKAAIGRGLWDDLAANPDEVPIHDWQIKELARRKTNLQRNPASVTDWESVKAVCAA
jgi:putative addiction module component